MCRTIRITSLLCLCLLCAMAFASCQKEDKSGKVETYVYDVGDFTTNIKDSKKMLNCLIKIDITDKNMLKVLEGKDYVAKDTIVRRLREITEEELAQPGLETALAESIVQELNEVMQVDSFYKVYFTRFVYQ